MRSAQPGLGPRGRRGVVPLAPAQSEERAAWPRATQDVARQRLATLVVEPAGAGPPRGGFALGEWPPAAQAASARLRQAAVRIARWVHAARGYPRGRARRRGSRGTATLCAAWPEARLRAPPIAQERVEQQPDGLVRITLKKAYAEREACPRGMGRSPLTWIRFRYCADWPARSLPSGDAHSTPGE